MLEPRFTTRVLRTLPTLRKKLDAAELAHVIRHEGVYTKGMLLLVFLLLHALAWWSRREMEKGDESIDWRGKLTPIFLSIAIAATDAPHQIELLNYLHNPPASTALAPAVAAAEKMDVDALIAAVVPTPKVVEKLLGGADQPFASTLPEGNVYLSLLVVVWLLDHKEFEAVRFELFPSCSFSFSFPFLPALVLPHQHLTFSQHSSDAFLALLLAFLAKFYRARR